MGRVKSGRIDDAWLKRHAEVLARIVPLLGLSDTEVFWRRVHRWSVRTLESAIAEFIASGEVEKFRLLATRENTPSGYWDDFATLERELRPLAEQLGQMPSTYWLHAHGRSSLVTGIISHGGPAAVAKRLGVSFPQGGRGRFKEWTVVEATLRAVIADLGGRFPTQGDLKSRKLSGLTAAVNEHHGGMIAVRTRLGFVIVKQENGHWSDFENVKRELETVIAQTGAFPGHDELRQMGLSSLSAAITKHHGGIAAVRMRMDVRSERGRRAWGHWDEWAVVEATLRPLIEELGAFPTKEQFAERGLSGLYDALSEKHGGVIRSRERLGLETSSVPRGHWTWEQVETTLRDIERCLGHFPSYRDLQQSEHVGVLSAIQRNHGGMTEVRKRLDCELGIKPMGYWRSWGNVERELVTLASHLGRFPLHTDIKEAKLNTLSTAIQRFGGMTAVKTRLGFTPITDADIEMHASDLARVILTLRCSTDIFWDTVRERWLRRDLEAAVAAYRANGSLEPFLTLLAAA